MPAKVKTLNSWDIIKAGVLREERGVNCGAQVKLNVAADLFVLLRPKLKDLEAADAAFNADDDARKALLSRGFLQEVGLLRDPRA